MFISSIRAASCLSFLGFFLFFRDSSGSLQNAERTGAIPDEPSWHLTVCVSMDLPVFVSLEFDLGTSKKVATEFVGAWGLVEGAVNDIERVMMSRGLRNNRRGKTTSILEFYESIFLPCVADTRPKEAAFLQVGAHTFFPPSRDLLIYRLAVEQLSLTGVLVEAEPTVYAELYQRLRAWRQRVNGPDIVSVHAAACPNTSSDVTFYSAKKEMLLEEFRVKSPGEARVGQVQLGVDPNGNPIIGQIPEFITELGSMDEDTFGRTLYGTALWSAKTDAEKAALIEVSMDKHLVQCLSPNDLIKAASESGSHVKAEDILLVITDAEGADADIVLAMLQASWRPLLIHLEYSHVNNFCSIHNLFEGMGYFAVAHDKSDVVLVYDPEYDKSRPPDQPNGAPSFRYSDAATCLERLLGWD